MENAYSMLNISEDIQILATLVEKNLTKQFDIIDQKALYNQSKVLKAFKDYKVSQVHFNKTTGYGYDDAGREIIEKMYAQIFNAEDALVRVQFVNGTHAISTALYAMLMPNDTMLSITGMPYDTIKTVIGIDGYSELSLKNYGVKYAQIELIDNDFDYKKIGEYLNKNKVKLIEIQRSRGYSTRESLSIEKIEKVIKYIKNIDSSVIVMVDNCYGEFVDTKEPTDVGADLICGSLIKNMGGGLCETGAYIVGKKSCIDLCAQRLTCPGIGKECGATLDQNRNILQGLYMAPSVVKSALRTAIFTAKILEMLGYEVYPKFDEIRSDIIQTVVFNNKEKLISFIQGIQYASPVDSNVTALPWNMPGYTDQVIMAAGTFIEGASIELSADSPIRSPYIAYIQGGITYESAKLAICSAIQNMINNDKNKEARK